MKTLEKRIRACVAEGNKAFVPYMMAGDGGLDTLKEKLLFLQEAGVTAIEIGIPFSDPVADGEAIQQAGARALAEGVTLRKVLEELQKCKDEVAVPLVVMTYLNPILAFGIPQFVEACEEAGIAGLIIPDMPLEESGPLREKLEGTDIAWVPLVTLTSSDERIAKIAESAEGFLYAVTVNGITGERNAFGDRSILSFATCKGNQPCAGIGRVRHFNTDTSEGDGQLYGRRHCRKRNCRSISPWRAGKNP